ncbi:MAG: hypoxanthine phosphoribosyltransferase [Deltaproteobacteria bacterium]|nr:hypoxanthine phosphoribosyltransferase [Deltaproteobacteria bacterium]
MIKHPHKILISKNKISKRTAALGQKITRDYQGKDLVVVCVLKGAFMFCADLIRHIGLPLQCEFFGISSYGAETQSSGIIKTTLDVSSPLHGKDILIVEDIVDTGLTIDYLIKTFSMRHPTSLKVCTLLLKPECLKTKVTIDYCGFEIGKNFVVGYGMDHAEKYRNASDLLLLFPKKR